MERSLEKELLDELPSGDPRALRSRQDLRRLNFCMGNARILARTLQKEFSRHLSFQIVDLGAGDGELLLRVARRLRGKWRGVDAVLLDRQETVSPGLAAQFAAHHWRVRPVTGEALPWLAQTELRSKVIVANLFLHHFTETQLQELFCAAAEKTDVLIAVEPRRARWPLFCSRWLGLIGCGPVTRHDAPISVRAGFAGRELSTLWPDVANWDLTEHAVGWFSHLFVARRRTPAPVVQPVIDAVFGAGTESADPPGAFATGRRMAHGAMDPPPAPRERV